MAWGSCGHSLFLGVYTVHCGGAGLLGAGIDLAGRGLVSGHWGRGDDRRWVEEECYLASCLFNLPSTRLT